MLTGYLQLALVDSLGLKEFYVCFSFSSSFFLQKI